MSTYQTSQGNLKFNQRKPKPLTIEPYCNIMIFRTFRQFVTPEILHGVGFSSNTLEVCHVVSQEGHGNGIRGLSQGNEVSGLRSRGRRRSRGHSFRRSQEALRRDGGRRGENEGFAHPATEGDSRTRRQDHRGEKEGDHPRARDRSSRGRPHSQGILDLRPPRVPQSRQRRRRSPQGLAGRPHRPVGQGQEGALRTGRAHLFVGHRHRRRQQYPLVQTKR